MRENPYRSHNMTTLSLRAVALLAMTLAAQSAQADAGKQNLVSFQASSTQELTQDLLVLTLQATKEGAQAADVQAALKRTIEQALVEARKSAAPGFLEVRTGGFTVQPRYGSTGKVNGWQGHAEIVLEGSDTGRLTQLAGRLNQMNVVNVGYGLSRALREQQESILTRQAIERFKARAAQIAHDFGYKGYTLAEVSVSSTEPGFEGRPMVMAMRAKAVDMAADAPLPVEPGKGTLSVVVNGQVSLTP